MKREIKFRAWVEDAEVMIYSDSHKIEDSDYWWETDPFRVGCITGSTGGNQFEPPEPIVTYYENIMQFTGLKDKNGKEIYEGDIVKLCKTGSRYDETLFEIGFRIGSFEMQKEYLPPLSFIYMAVQLREKYRISEDYQVMDYIEVIGNIYENPDLLTSPK